jgi:hypothetical protein
MSIVRDLFALPGSLLETGLVAAQSAMKSAQGTINKLTGLDDGSVKGAPIDGPADLDLAVADFANRLARVYRYGAHDLKGLPETPANIMAAARESFRNISLTDLRNLALPVQLTLSVGTLVTEAALRGLVSLSILGPARMPRFIDDFFEIVTETPVFAGLEYGELIERCELRLGEAPADQRCRLELARVYSKCGRYDDAAVEYNKIPPDSSYFAAAMHEAGTSLYRAGEYQAAMRAEVLSMNAKDDERARLVLFLASDKTGGYPAWVPSPHRMEVKAGRGTPTVRFEEIAAKIGLDKTSGGRGTAVFDFNNDGLLDIAIAASFGGSSLYRNNGDGTFTDVSVVAGLDACTNTFGVIAGDYNNDGFTDLYLTRSGFYVGEGQLMRNNGDGTFTDVTKEAGLDKVWGPAFNAAWVDYDNDGRLDLFVANNLGGLFERKTPNRLFHNNGDGTFTETTEQAGLNTIWPTIGCAWGDYDNDGFMDLFLSNGLGRSQLYHNNGDGTLTDVSAVAGVDAMAFGSPAFFWDYDNDGWMDIGQYIWSDHDDVVKTLRDGAGPEGGQHMRVFRNNRNGTFTEVSEELGLTECWGTMSGAFGDFNNDGYLDLALGNGSPKLDRLDPMTIFESDGTKFRNTSFAAGLPYTGKSHGVNMADLFGDGRLSILVGDGGAYPGDLLTAGIYCPTTLPGNYVNVRLVGTKSNRNAVGARISIEGGGRKQYREVCGGSNFGCMPFEQHFGIGELRQVDAVEVRWPSGLRQRFEGAWLNQTIEFTEGETVWTDVYAKLRAKLLDGANVR